MRSSPLKRSGMDYTGVIVVNFQRLHDNSKNTEAIFLWALSRLLASMNLHLRCGCIGVEISRVRKKEKKWVAAGNPCSSSTLVFASTNEVVEVACNVM